MSDYAEFENKMKKTCEALTAQLATIRAGRANASVLDQIQVGLGQALLVSQRNHLPVDVVDLVERGLTAGLEGIGSQFLFNIGNAVQRRDGSTHIEGLSQHDGTGKSIMVISLESIIQRFSQMVDRSLGSADIGGSHL